jgi:hypothetical protein
MSSVMFERINLHLAQIEKPQGTKLLVSQRENGEIVLSKEGSSPGSILIGNELMNHIQIDAVIAVLTADLVKALIILNVFEWPGESQFESRPCTSGYKVWFTFEGDHPISLPVSALPLIANC